MKVYRLIDDGTCVLNTLDPLKVVEKFEELSKTAKPGKFFVWLEAVEVN